MSMFLVNSSQLRQKADRLEQMNEQFKQAVTALSDSEANLATMWEGDAQKAFRTAFTNDRTKFDEFYKGITLYIQALRAAADEYDGAESRNVSLVTN